MMYFPLSVKQGYATYLAVLLQSREDVSSGNSISVYTRDKF